MLLAGIGLFVLLLASECGLGLVLWCHDCSDSLPKGDPEWVAVYSVLHTSCAVFAEIPPILAAVVGGDIAVSGQVFQLITDMMGSVVAQMHSL